MLVRSWTKRGLQD